jgi:hypothetical protein
MAEITEDTLLPVATPQTTKHAGGRPPIKVDLDRVQRLAQRQFTLEEIATRLGMDVSTLYKKKRRFVQISDAIKIGKLEGLEAVSNRLFQDAIAGNTTAQIFIMKCKGGWRDTPDPSLVTVNVLGGSEAEREELEIARAMTSEERQQYIAIVHKAALRRKGLAEIEATPVEPGEPTGEEIPIDEAR